MGKVPRFGKLPTTQKEPKAPASQNWDQSYPSWRIRKLEMLHPQFGWRVIDSSKLEDIRKKLGNFESMTWGEILVKSKKQNHSVQVSALCKEARDHLRDIGQVDIDELVSLHLSGLERIWGILDRNVLSLLWWDPNHSVCPSIKKHT